MTQYGFYFDSTRCTGCRTCEMACKDYNDLPASYAFRRVFDYEGGDWKDNGDGTFEPTSWAYHVSMACNHCEEPACVANCPVGAYSKLEDGTVIQDHSVCIGCKTCISACPYGAPSYDEASSTTFKCDGCYDRRQRGELPACVAACPGANLALDDMESLQGAHAADIVSDESSGTKPNFVITVDAALAEEPDDIVAENHTA